VRRVVCWLAFPTADRMIPGSVGTPTNKSFPSFCHLSRISRPTSSGPGCSVVSFVTYVYTTFAPTDISFMLAFYSTSTDAIQHLQLPVSLNKTLQSLALIFTLLLAFHIIVKNVYWRSVTVANQHEHRYSIKTVNNVWRMNVLVNSLNERIACWLKKT
jgi:hypothetical protein